MITSLATKRISKASSGIKAGVVVVFYFLTFLIGGFFLSVGGKLGIVANLTVAVSYIAVTVLFYTLSKGA